MVSPFTFCGVTSPKHFSSGRNLTLFTNTVSWGTLFSSRTITPSGVCLLLLLPQPQPWEALPEERNPVRWCISYKRSFLHRWHFTLWAERPQGHWGLQGTSLHWEKWNAKLRCCRGLMLPKTHLHAPCIYLITWTVGLLQCVWMLYLMNAGTYQSSPERVGIHIGICQMAGW